jgi:hypothetical protein
LACLLLVSPAQDTAQVLCSELGLTPAQLAELSASGAIAMAGEIAQRTAKAG